MRYRNLVFYKNTSEIAIALLTVPEIQQDTILSYDAGEVLSGVCMRKSTRVMLLESEILIFTLLPLKDGLLEQGHSHQEK